MGNQFRAVAFNVDGASLHSLQEGLPEWEIELIIGATSDSLNQDWNPEITDLAVIGGHGSVAETVALCRGLRSQAGRAHTPLLVLVLPDQDNLVTAVLGAGADSCLVLPVHPKQLASMWDRVRQGNRPGHHTLNLDPAQQQDYLQDEGGQG